MRVCNVGLLLSSPLLTAGLQSVLRGVHGLAVTDIGQDISPAEYERRISSSPLSLIIVDPFTARHCPADVTSVLLAAGQVPDSERTAHAAVLSVYDSAETVIERITSLTDPSKSSSADARGSDLSPREKDVILAIVKGLSNKEIATEMNVSVNTVMTHRRNIASKLQIHSPAGLTIFAIATGLVKIEDVAL